MLKVDVELCFTTLKLLRLSLFHSLKFYLIHSFTFCPGVRPYKCHMCDKAFTQRCSLESHCRKIHGIEFRFTYKERRGKVYVCEDCGHVTNDPEDHFVHIKESHPYNPALLRCFDKRQFKFDGCNQIKTDTIL